MDTDDDGKPGESRAESSPGRMGGRFYVKPYAVHDKLLNLKQGDLNTVYDSILRNAVIAENWYTEGAWVSGKFQTNVRQIAGWLGKGSSYTRILLNRLIKANLVAVAADGSYELPMYKQKKDAAIRPSDIHAIREKLDQLEKQAEARDKKMENFINGATSSPDAEKPSEKKEGEVIHLSGDKIISVFYRGIGQSRIGAKKREKARKEYKALRGDFTPEEVSFAVKWTLENAREKPYDFALIQDTIGQALATRQRTGNREQEAAAQQKAVDKEHEERERQESERDEWMFYKAEMPPKEYEELREKAIAALTVSGEYATEFVSDILIEIKETEILRIQFPEGIPVREQIYSDD